MKRLLLCFLLLYIVGCSSNKHCQKLPALNIPSKIHTISKDHKITAKQPNSWDIHLKLVHHLQKQSLSLRNQAIKVIFTAIRDKTKSILLPVLIDPEDQMAMIAVAVRETYLIDATNYQLSKKLCKKISHHWEQLIKAEYYLICSTIVSAELKQKWHLFTQKCSHLEPFDTLKENLNDLSSIKLLEEEKENIVTLLKACQQLAIANEEVEIPTWEYDFTRVNE